MRSTAITDTAMAVIASATTAPSAPRSVCWCPAAVDEDRSPPATTTARTVIAIAATLRPTAQPATGTGCTRAQVQDMARSSAGRGRRWKYIATTIGMNTAAL